MYTGYINWVMFTQQCYTTPTEKGKSTPIHNHMNGSHNVKQKPDMYDLFISSSRTGKLMHDIRYEGDGTSRGIVTGRGTGRAAGALGVLGFLIGV